MTKKIIFMLSILVVFSGCNMGQVKDLPGIWKTYQSDNKVEYFELKDNGSFSWKKGIEVGESFTLLSEAVGEYSAELNLQKSIEYPVLSLTDEDGEIFVLRYSLKESVLYLYDNKTTMYVKVKEE